MNNLKIFYFIFVGMLLLGSGIFSHIKSKTRIINNLEVIYRAGSPQFVTDEIVNKLLIQSQDSLFYKQKDMVDLSKLEQVFLTHPMIKDADVYVFPSGELSVEIEERKPVVRVEGEQSFYVDETGVKMPLSSSYSAKVPLFYGPINQTEMRDLAQLVLSISSDQFLNQQVIDYSLTGSQFAMNLRSYPFEVVWGKNQDFQTKSAKIKQFCAYYNTHKENKYKRINLTFQNQVIAQHN